MKSSVAIGTIVLAVATDLAAAVCSPAYPTGSPPTAYPVSSTTTYPVSNATTSYSATSSTSVGSSTTTSAVTSSTTTGTPTEACGLVSASWAAQTAATATPTVEATLAYECLKSVPINKLAALKYLDALVPYLEWQSDVAFKKNPPAGYFYPPYDMWAELARVRSFVQHDQYPNEYSWQLDLFLSVYGKGHDGHLVVYTDLLTTAVEWQRPFALVSISEDGSSLPEIKVYDDVAADPETASTITLINGIDAATYISDTIFQASGNQDADAAYNSMFFSKAYSQAGSSGYFKTGGRIRFIYPGNATTFTFANGTYLDLPNVARLKGNWTGVTDGKSAFNHFCSGALSTASTATATATATSTAVSSSSTLTPTTTETPEPAPTGLPGYPAPVIISSDTIVSGYYLEGPGFDDVAVLVMTSFSPDDPSEFQRVVQDFFADAVKAGKKKLVVDVQVNGGGYIFQGYDTFRQLFPDIVQQGTGRWRHSDGFTAVSKVFSDACADYDPNTASEDLIYTCESTYDWRYDLDADAENFSSFEDKFGPVSYNGDEYTNVMQWNFSNPLDTSNTTFGIGYDVTGYGSRQNFTRPFGGPENIVVLFDGYCASTCTLFSQFMKWDAGVKSIAMGGRPKVGAIQGVGGVKGSQSYGFANVLSQVQEAAAQTDDPALLAEFARYTTDVAVRSPTASLNVKDEILPINLYDGMPAQFITEESSCRLYWTAAMHDDINALWKAAAQAAFNGGKCAFGDIFDPSPKTRRVESRPAPFNKPRFTIPKTQQHMPIVRRALAAKSNQFMANQHMMVID